MNNQPTLNGKPAVRIKARKTPFKTNKARFYDCEGDSKWISYKYSQYEDSTNTLLIEEWLYKKIFENE